MVTIPVGSYTPDMPAFNNPGSANIVNCVPRTESSYGPYPQLNTYGTALNSTCLGSYCCLDSADDVHIFAGDVNNLYTYTTTTASIVSNGTNPYNVTSGEKWNFALFGSRVLATDFESPIQSYSLLTSSKFSDLANGNIISLMLVAGSGYTNGTYALSVTNPGAGSGFAGTVTVSGGILSSYAITSVGSNYPQTATISVPAGAGAGSGGSITPTIQTIAPKARYMAQVKGFLVLGNTSDAVGGNQPQRVWWSSSNDPTTWPTPGGTLAATLQSSYNDLFGEGGWIKGIVGNLGTADGAVFMEHAIWQMIYVGPPVVFNFIPIEGARGTEMPGSIAQLGGTVFYVGEDGIYQFDGTTSVPIGYGKVDKTFFADLDFSYLSRVTGAIDPINKLYVLAYPGAGNSNGNPNKILTYHWPSQKWSVLQVNCEHILRAYAFGNNVLDSIGSVSLDSVTYNKFPMDSSVWNGGQLLLGGFDVSHQLSFFNGPNLGATIETTEGQPYPDKISFINNCRPLVDGGIPTVSFAWRNRLVDVPNYNIGTVMNQIGTCPQTINGRYLRASVTIPNGSLWTHFQGIDVDAVPNGVM